MTILYFAFMSHYFRMGWWNFPCYPIGMARPFRSTKKAD